MSRMKSLSQIPTINAVITLKRLSVLFLFASSMSGAAAPVIFRARAKYSD